MIPAFLSIDVEPDAFQIFPDGSPKWAGYAATYTFVAKLREALAGPSGQEPRFGWYFRTDPQIEQVCGSADFALTSHPDRIARLRGHGDYIGVHAHALRWSNTHRKWVHDFSDAGWLRDSTHKSLDAFERWNGSPCLLFRAGAGFMSEDLVAVLDERGVAVDLGLEPVASWAVRASDVIIPTDSSPIIGTFTNCAAAQRVPYRPSRGDFRRPGQRDARKLAFIPYTTGPSKLPKAGYLSQLKRRVRSAIRPRPAYALYPTLDFPSDAYYWDLVAYQLHSMRRPYLSIALRSDVDGPVSVEKLHRRLLALAKHPLAAQLAFVNPLDVLDTLLPTRH